MENNKSTLENISKQAADNSSMLVSEATKKAFQKKLFVSNFWHFSFFNFNIFYSIAILLIASGISICIATNCFEENVESVESVDNVDYDNGVVSVGGVNGENDEENLGDVNDMNEEENIGIVNGVESLGDVDNVDNVNNVNSVNSVDSVEDNNNQIIYVSRQVHKTVYDTTTVIINKEVIIDENNAE